MAYYNEMTYENISKAVGFPVNTVKTWVRRLKSLHPNGERSSKRAYELLQQALLFSSYQQYQKAHLLERRLY